MQRQVLSLAEESECIFLFFFLLCFLEDFLGAHVLQSLVHVDKFDIQSFVNPPYIDKPLELPTRGISGNQQCFLESCKCNLTISVPSFGILGASFLVGVGF